MNTIVVLQWMNIFYQLNKRATTISDNTGTRGLVRVPQLELMAIDVIGSAM